MSVGLCMITNKPDMCISTVQTYRLQFDEVYITVADKDKKAHHKILKHFMEDEHIHVSFFKWKDDFAAARNYNLEQVKTDYWMWLDDDDTVENIERLPEVISYMQTNDLDLAYLRYDYDQNELGDAISDHWRERIIRTRYQAYWHAPVHETLQSKVPARLERFDAITVKHKKELVDRQVSLERNERILRKDWAKTKDPRDALYLGSVAIVHKDYPQAIDWFLQHIKTAGSEEDKYRSWCRIADCEWIQKRYEQALYATDEAIKLRPNFPDAYFIKVLIYTNTEAYDKGIEWLKVALSKPVPDTLAVIDPTLYTYRGMAMGAMCYLFSGRVKEAYRMYQAVV